MMLPGFRSRWTIPSRCAFFNVSAISPNVLLSFLFKSSLGCSASSLTGRSQAISVLSS